MRPDRQPQPAPWWQPQPAPGQRLRRIDGFTVAVTGPDQDEDDSTGPDVFLVHGMADASDTWAPLLPALVGCRVWRLDLPWSGRDGTDWPGQALALDWLRAALELCPAHRGTFIGHSFGATVLLEWLATDPHAPALADAAMLIAPFYCAPERRPDWDQIDSFARAVPQRFAHSLRVRMGGNVPEPVVLEAMARKLGERVLPDAVLELFRLFLASRRWPLATLRTPLQLVIGAVEGTLAQESAQALAQAMPGALLHVLPDCGHYPMHEQPAALRALVADMVRTHSSETGASA